MVAVEAAGLDAATEPRVWIRLNTMYEAEFDAEAPISSPMYYYGSTPGVTAFAGSKDSKALDSYPESKRREFAMIRATGGSS